MDKLAIVILNWNGAKMLAQYLPTVLNYSRDEAVVYVADNASTDTSVSLLQRQFPECRLIQLDRNWGFAEGYNKALGQIEAKYYLLLNSDIEVTHHWLTPLVEFMDVHPEVAACQPKLLSIYNKDMFEYAGASGGYLDRYGYPFCRGRIFNTEWMNLIELGYTLDVAECMVYSAINRKESRGSHQRLDGPNEAYRQRDDEHFLKHSLAIFNKEKNAPDISLSDVKITTFKPAKRVYGAEADAAEAARKAKEAI